MIECLLILILLALMWGNGNIAECRDELRRIADAVSQYQGGKP